MEIYCEDLHRKKEEIKKYFRDLESLQGDKEKGKKEEPNLALFIDDSDLVKAFLKHKDEIKIAITKNARVYLMASPDYGTLGVFHSPDRRQLVQTLNKAKDGFAQGEGICKLMACRYDGVEPSTRAYVIQIINDQFPEIPPTIMFSMGQILVQREGVGIAEAGK